MKCFGDHSHATSKLSSLGFMSSIGPCVTADAALCIACGRPNTHVYLLYSYVLARRAWHAGKWGGPTNLGMGLATFNLMAQLLSHHLVDMAHAWTTRWKTNSPPKPLWHTGKHGCADGMAPRCAALLALFRSCAGLSSICHRQIDAAIAQMPTLPWGRRLTSRSTCSSLGVG